MRTTRFPAGGRLWGLLSVAAVVALLAAAPARAAAPAVVNGSMTDGTDVPRGWTKTYDDAKAAGKVKACRDTDVFVKGPASLRLESVGGVASGNVSQTLTGLGGGTLEFRGHLRSAGDVAYATVALIIFGPNNKVLVGWRELGRTRATADWRRFATKVEMPPAAERGLLLLYMKGTGKVWLDEVEVVQSGAPRPVPAKTAKPVERSKNAPAVECVYAVDRDIIGLRIQEGRYVHRGQARYEKRDGDKIRVQGKGLHARRDVVRGGKVVGLLIGDGSVIRLADEIHGEKINQDQLALPTAYRVRSDDDEAWKQPAHPVAVYQKSKPNGHPAGGRYPMRHRVYLKLPRPMREGRTYVVELPGVRVRRRSVRLKYDPRGVRSEAVHVNHLGFRPDEPHKFAFLSVWLGTGGAHSYPKGLPFRVLDEKTRRDVFQGTCRLVKAATDREDLCVTPVNPDRINRSFTDVYRMDFGSLRRPGTYRVCVDGVGTSYPFRIAPDVWEPAYRMSMLGFLHQRSGLALDGRQGGYKHPRDLHPADGVKVYVTDFDAMTSAGQGDTFKQLLAHCTTETTATAWGGYHDAGDWDRRTGHLDASRQMMDLMDMRPDYFAKMKLALPAGEADNAIPDVLDEVLWNLDCYLRLQTPAGGIRHGIESAEHPKPGECSWQESLKVMVFAPDVPSSYEYVAAAAQLARLLAPHDATRAKRTADSAARAMAWAEVRWLKLRENPPKLKNATNLLRGIRDRRNLAALAMYRLTRKSTWHDAFKQDTRLKDPNPLVWKWNSHDQRDAMARYAMLGDDLADAQLKRQARKALGTEADRAAADARKNAWGLGSNDPGHPIHWGFYGAFHPTTLIYAHHVLGRSEHLEAILTEVSFLTGGNPMNRTYTVGLGHEPVHWAFHLDSLNSGQPSPKGITVLGQFDHRLPWYRNHWSITWVYRLTVVPKTPRWPTNEFYIDTGNIPDVHEYMPNNPMGSVTLAWGYLAGRKQVAAPRGAAR